MTQSDPLLPVLAGLVVDVVWWLECCGDEEVDPDSAVKMMESVAWVLSNLPAEQRTRFLDVLKAEAQAEQHAGRREVLLAFPFACGLVEDELAGPVAPWSSWVHPASRRGPDS